MKTSSIFSLTNSINVVVCYGKSHSLNTAVWRRWIYYAYNQTCRQEHSYNYTKA